MATRFLFLLHVSNIFFFWSQHNLGQAQKYFGGTALKSPCGYGPALNPTSSTRFFLFVTWLYCTDNEIDAKVLLPLLPHAVQGQPVPKRRSVWNDGQRWGLHVHVPPDTLRPRLSDEKPLLQEPVPERRHVHQLARRWVMTIKLIFLCRNLGLRFIGCQGG